MMRFVIGQTSDPAKEAEILSEARQSGGFMRLTLQVSTHMLTHTSNACPSISEALASATHSSSASFYKA